MAKKDDSLHALEAKLFETATAFQQDLYEMSGDWHCYEYKEFHYLKDYIGCAMFGPPSSEAKDESRNKLNKSQNRKNDENMNDVGYYVYEEKQQETIKLIYDKILENGNRYNSRGTIFCNVIFNVIFNKKQAQKALKKKRREWAAAYKEKKDKDGKDASECLIPEVQVYPVPVFKVKQVRTKCTLSDSGSVSVNTSEKIYYIDNVGRVYKEFEDYLDNNTLPKCTMVYPKDGKYQMNLVSFNKLNPAMKQIGAFRTDVWLENRQSPADSVASKVLMGGDIATTIITAASMGVGIAAMFTPVAPIAAIAGGIGGLVSGSWGVGRSAQHLADRGLHDETINPIQDRSALGAWIGIVGGSVGLAASGGTALISRAIRTGTTISRAATVAYDVVLVGNLVVNGVGLSFKSYDMYASYMENKQISPVDVVMLAGHLFFFSNSVINIRFARTIIESSQAQILKDYETSLRSARHRKEFQRMARNTRAAGINDISSNEEIIRGINKISNKDDFFQAMVRNRKSLSASSARAAFSDGKVTVNSVLTIDPIEFANLPKEVRTEVIRNVVNPQTDISSGSKIHDSPGVSNTISGVNPANSASKAAHSADIKPNNANGKQPKDFREAKPNLVGSNVRTEITVKAKIQPNETSYKNVDTTNGTILKEFCTRHANSMMQAAPPHIADFSNVLTELRSVANYAQIFTILLEIAHKIWQALSRDRKITIGKVLGQIVEFVWNYVKMCIRRQISDIPIDNPALRNFLIPILQELAILVEQKIDIWVEAFTEWLEKKCPQSISIS